VYLFRGGVPVAALTPPDAGIKELEDIAEFWADRERETARSCRDLWASVGDADEATQQRVRELIDQVLEQVEDAADIAAANAAMARVRAGERPVPHEQVIADYAGDLSADPAD
jgi:hypothetical protein